MPIPIYDASGRLRRFADAETIIEHRHHFRLVLSRRGKLRVAAGQLPHAHQVQEAHLRAIDSLDNRPTSSLGLEFRQPLKTGFVHALRGVLGSQ